jgi:hypothetical protein
MIVVMPIANANMHKTAVFFSIFIWLFTDHTLL